MSTSQVEMILSCRNLLNMDVLSLSDPYCIVYSKEPWQDRFYELGRTEVIFDCLSPEWVKKFVLDYNFETIQRLRFEVWDLDPHGKDFLGCHETTLGEIVSFRSRRYVRSLRGLEKSDRRDRGEIIIVTEEVSTCKLTAQIQFAAEHLPRTCCGLMRPDPFLIISRQNMDGTYSVVHKSKRMRSSKEPVWPAMSISVRTLCNGDFERKIRLDVCDYHRSGKHRLIGSCFTKLSELTNEISRNTSKMFKLTRPTAKPQADDKNNNPLYQPSLIVLDIILNKEITFLDYIKSGTQMHFAVAIDFTSSNGNPQDPTSLHYLDTTGQSQNPYEVALHSVGQIISQYNTLGLFPAFGFGAKLPPNGDVSHQFPLNSKPLHPYCKSISEIIKHYRHCLETVTLHGPANFSPVIHNTAQIAAKHMNSKHYFILLIVTDGIIDDMYQTKREIVDASTLPLSIIIVGVGDADFTAMNELDSDWELLAVDGLTAKRDIVQFVPLNKFMSRNKKAGIRSQADLAREVLAEIPEQMISFMMSKGFLPGPLPSS